MIGWLPVKSAAEAQAALDAARRILKQLGAWNSIRRRRGLFRPVRLRVPRLQNQMRVESFLCPKARYVVGARQDALYAYPKEKSIRRFMDQVRQRTKRTASLGTEELIAGLNPALAGAGVSITNAPTSANSSNDSTAGSGDASGHIGTGAGAMPGWKRLPASQLYGEYELIRLLYLIPSLASWHR